MWATLKSLTQRQKENFIIQSQSLLARLPSLSLSQLREPSNWKKRFNKAVLTERALHFWLNNITVDLTALQSTIQSSKWREGTKVLQQNSISLWHFFSFFVWLRLHVALWLWPDGSQLIAKSHSWRCATVQAFWAWRLPSDRPNKAKREASTKWKGYC